MGGFCCYCAVIYPEGIVIVQPRERSTRLMTPIILLQFLEGVNHNAVRAVGVLRSKLWFDPNGA